MSFLGFYTAIINKPFVFVKRFLGFGFLPYPATVLELS